MLHSKVLASSSSFVSFFFLNRPPVLRKNIPCVNAGPLFHICGVLPCENGDTQLVRPINKTCHAKKLVLALLLTFFLFLK